MSKLIKNVIFLMVTILYFFGIIGVIFDKDSSWLEIAGVIFFPPYTLIAGVLQIVDLIAA